MDRLKGLDRELNQVKGLVQPTVEPAPEPEAPEVKSDPVKEEKKEELVRLTIRISQDLEERLIAHQRKLRRQGVSKRDSSLNAIVVKALEEYLKREKAISTKR